MRASMGSTVESRARPSGNPRRRFAEATCEPVKTVGAQVQVSILPGIGGPPYNEAMPFMDRI